MVRRALGSVAVAATLLLAVAANANARTTLHPRVAGALGLFPSWRSIASGDIATGAPVPVVYHGGPVMNGGVTIHTIFWAPGGASAYDAGYESLVEQFFTDAANDSGGTSNMFSVLNQYGDESGVDTSSPSQNPGDYSLSYASPIQDTDPYPDSSIQCASPNGAQTCITDGEIQNEIESVAPSNERGLNNIWFVFLPPAVDECITAGVCGTNSFAGYHSLMNVAGDSSDLTIYGVIIDPIVEYPLPPGQDPEGNPDAEATVDTAAHETVEAITDPEGDGWMDSNGFEVADKCEFGPQIGTPLGYANGSPYNELINSDEYLIQEMWSNDDGGCVQSTSATASPLPLPQVDLTQFSSTVAGNIGTHSSGVGVDVKLVRTDALGDLVDVAHAHTATNGVGAWSTSLAPFAVGDDRDLVWVTYSGGGTTLKPDLITTGSGGDPQTESGWTGWFDLDTGFAISNVDDFVSLGPCFQTGVLGLSIGVTAQESPTELCNTQTDFATETPLSSIDPTETVTMSSNDNRAFYEPIPASPYPMDQAGNPVGALVNLKITLGEPDAFTPYTGPLAADFPDYFGGPTGMPSCTADLELGAVLCTGLVPGNEYSVTRTRGNDTLLAVAADDGTNDDGSFVVGPFAGAVPLTGGDVLTLSNGSVTLTTLHVAHLVAAIDGEDAALDAGSTCQPGQYYGPAITASPISTFAGIDGSGGATLTGEICPLNGSADGLPADAIEQTDDASGGTTQTEVADVEDTSPMEGEVVYGAFTALAEAGFPGSDNTIIQSNDPVAVTIAPAAGGSAVFSSGNVNTTAGVAVPALTPDSYDATWTWSDANGDTRTVTTRFVEEPALTGPSGPTGPVGPAGRAGPAGAAARVTCKVTHSRVVCVVSYPTAKKKTKKGSVLLRLARGAKVAGLGRAQLHDGRASVTLRTRGSVDAGRWLVTVVRLGAHGGAQTTTLTVRLP